MKNIFYFLVLVFLIIPFASSATIQGNVFDIGLDTVENAIVEINTVPMQRVVAINGRYSFSSVPPGDYTITAISPNREITTKENITILREDGTYNIDLFLIPELEQGKEDNNLIYYVFVVLVFIVFSLIIFLKKYKKRNKKETEQRIDEDLDKVLNIIKKEGNRTTQKHIREQLGLSEAKVSLMVTELEDKGIVKRIKKGRSNIVILK